MPMMSALGYFATGDNLTNYGNNATRTVTWTVSDGSQGVPDGQGQNTATTTITINAVNDALKGLGAELLYSPITPRRVLEAIAAARAGRPANAKAEP